MRKIEEFLKRGVIVGLVVVSLSGIVTPLQTTYAATSNTVTSMNVTQSKHKGTTGHVTGITIAESDWEYITPQYVITDLNLPLNYINPWYSKGTSDGAKAVKNFYYLGTVIYDDKIGGDKVSTDGLNEDEQQNYEDLKATYKAALVRSKANGLSDKQAKYNAEAALLDQGVRYGSTQLPLIYEMITGKKFNYQYWYDEGISGIEDYAGYKSGDTSSDYKAKVSQGIRHNYAKGITVTGYDATIVKVYKVVVNGEARVYVKGLKKGTTTLTVKTTTNDGKTVSYKTKVTIGSAGTAIKYQTEVNPLSYAAYAMQKDGANFLGYLSKYGGFYTSHAFIGPGTIGQSEQTGNRDYLSVVDHPDYSGVSKTDYYKHEKADKSQFMKDFIEECGAQDMLNAGKTEYEVFDAVTTAIIYKLDQNVDNDNLPEFNWKSHHYTLEGKLRGRAMACEDEVGVVAGICEILGFNYYTDSSSSDTKIIVVLDGKTYYADSEGVDVTGCPEHNPQTISSSYSKLEDITLEELLSGKVTLNAPIPNVGASRGVYYKVSDTYEAGRFQYGAATETVKVDNSYGVLAADQGDVRLLTFHNGINPQWNKDANDTVSFRYTVPYMERAYYTLKKGATQQLNLVNGDFSDFSIKTSNSSVATVSSTGKIVMKGNGKATITLTSRKISGLSIKVLVSTSAVSENTAKEKAGTFYSKNDSIYSGDTTNIIAGNYMRIHE